MTATDDDHAALGSALRVLRKRAQLTQAQAAHAVGIRNTHVSAVERGERGISYSTMLALTRACGVGLRELVEEIERGEGKPGQSKTP
jgi:transcriptional regulator with XRE-family HTH domain